MKRVLGVAGVLLGLVLIGAVAVVGTPLLDPDLRAHPQPAADYAEAVARINETGEAEASLGLLPEGHSIALLTGARTGTAVVIFHGYTSAPEQFRTIAQGYRNQGFNVWVPRLPYNGEADAMTDDQSRLSSDVVRDFADASIDIASGLGDSVLVVGLSAGGAIGVWAAVARPDVSRVILISPFVLPAGYQPWQLAPIVRAIRLSPVDRYVWWDPVEQNAGPRAFSYPRYSFKGMAAFLGLPLWAKASRGSSTSRADVVLISNHGDPYVDWAYNESFLAGLVGPDRLTVHTIPAEAGLLHDVVCTHPLCDNHPRIRESYRYLSQGLGIPLPDPLG